MKIINERDRNKAEYFGKMIANTGMEESILSFGFYLSMKQDHLYNFGFYVDELDNYITFIDTLVTREKYFKDAIDSIKRRLNETLQSWDKKGVDKIIIICDDLFSYSYPAKSKSDDRVKIDKKLAEEFDMSKFNKETTSIRVIINFLDNHNIDMYKRFNVEITPERTMCFAVIQTIIATRALSQKRNVLITSK